MEWKDTYILYFFIFLITVVFIVLSIYFFSIIKLKWNILLLVLNKKYKQLKKLVYLCWKHDFNVISWTFNSFVYFYEHEYRETEDSYETNTEDFENGKIDIVNVYRYITEFRINNIRDHKKIFSIPIDKTIELFGSHFISYKFKVDSERRIHIMPTNNGNPMLTQINHDNVLYQLDNEVAKWILEKRKFFNL